MNWINLFIATSILLLCAASTATENLSRIIFNAPTDSTEQQIRKKLEKSDSVKDVVKLINESFRLAAPLYIIFGADDGPLYDPELNSILIPYVFLEEIKSRFKKANYASSGVSNEEASMDALMHTLFHELAHALIAMHEIPVVGKEEDAADALANILLIEYFEDGQEIVISAADLFDLESEDRETLQEEDFWDEHSLDAQRYYSGLCYVYGSDPEEYAHVAKEAGFSKERAESCISEYEITAENWFALLDSYLKPEPAKKTAPTVVID